VRRIFVKKFWWGSEFREFFKIIATLYPGYNHDGSIT